MTLSLQVFDLDEFEFDRAARTLVGISSIFPREVEIRSGHTGRVVRFRPITEEHPRFDHDFWDGEQAIYEPIEAQERVSLLILRAG